MKQSSVFLLCFIAVISSFIGCGNNQVRLQGKVTYSDDGSPLTAGSVCFETNSFLARGDLKPDGTFTVGTFTDKDGLPIGKYRVYITGATCKIGMADEYIPLLESLIDEKQTSVATSDLTFEVTPETKRYDIQVDRYIPKKKK